MRFSAVYILWLRQLKRYFRSKARIIGSLGQPLLFLIALGFGFGPIYAKAGGGNYMEFLAPGIIAMSILFTSVFTGIEIIWDRQFGFLKETLAAPVSRLDIVTGRTLGGATVAVFQGIIVLLLSMVFGFHVVNWWIIPWALFFMVLIAILFTSLGTAIASMLDDIQGFQLIVNFLIFPIFFLSAALFPLDGLPAALVTVAQLDPLTYGVDGLRYALTGAIHFSLAIDIGVLAILTCIIMGAAAYLFSKIQI